MSRSSAELTTTEQYILAQLLACGAVTPVEFENATKHRRTVREDRLERLRNKGFIQHTLYRE